MIVVTGATGNVGRSLVAALAAAGERVTAVARRIDPGTSAGVRHVPADLTDPGSLRLALDGATVLFLLTPGGVPAVDDVLEVARAGSAGSSCCRRRASPRGGTRR